jgi:nicotinic acid phosphoribosyltransferase
MPRPPGLNWSGHAGIWHSSERTRYTQTVGGLLTDLYQLTMAAGYCAAGKSSEVATFELFFR